MSDGTVSRVNTVLLIVVIGLLCWGLLKPKQIGRFQPYQNKNGITVALDTTTGKLCTTTAFPAYNTGDGIVQTPAGFKLDPADANKGIVLLHQPSPPEPMQVCSEIRGK